MRSLKRRAFTEVLKWCSGNVEHLGHFRSPRRDSPKFNIANQLVFAINTSGLENHSIMVAVISPPDLDLVPGHASA